MTSIIDKKMSNPINKFAQNLRILKRRCKKYENNSDYVYKLSHDVSSKKDTSRKWLIIMKKTKDTKTNEGRDNVSDDNYAKFRASELNVIKIINVNNPRLTKRRVINMYSNFRTIYMVGMIIKPNETFDEDINEICSSGIHYFKTMIAAYHYDKSDKYSGNWIYRHDNGEKKSEGEFLNGKRTGIWNFWHENGMNYLEGEYLNGECTGKWISWNIEGKKTSEGKYLNGKEIGYWIFWDDDVKSMEGDYAYGERTGKWIYWHKNGEKESEGKYIYGVRMGIWNYWYDNGRERMKGLYSRGQRDGKWTELYPDGKKRLEGEYVDGHRDGNWTYWYDNGEKNVRNYTHSNDTVRDY